MGTLEDLKQSRDLLDRAILALTPKAVWPRTDREIAVPIELPVADEMIDPAFSTRILRVTHPEDRESWRTQSSGNSWSADGKWFVALADTGGISLYDWDGKKFGAPVRLAGFATEVSFDRGSEGVVIYGGGYRNNEAILRRRTKDGYEDVVGVRELVPNIDEGGRTYLRDVCAAAGRVSFLFGGQRQDDDRYVFFNDGSGTTLIFDSVARLGCRLHYAGLDPSGRWLLLGPTSADMTRGLAPAYAWDTQTDKVAEIRASAGGHGVLTPGGWVNNPDDADAMQYLFRHLDSPDKPVEMIRPYPTPPAFQMASHLAWRSSGVVSATYRYGAGIKAQRREWDDEILQIGEPVQRLCHHRSLISDTVADYWSTPKPAASPLADGPVLFTSNWGKALGTNKEGPRQDVFMAVGPA